MTKFKAPPRPDKPKEYSAGELRKALSTMAKVVTLYGEVYMPIFLRIERELDLAERRELTRQKVKELAGTV